MLSTSFICSLFASTSFTNPPILYFSSKRIDKTNNTRNGICNIGSSSAPNTASNSAIEKRTTKRFPERSSYGRTTRWSTIELPATRPCANRWFSTRSFCSELLDLSRPGTYFLFQDYGRFTCFWIPYFTAIFEDYLELVHVEDSTYVFKLIKKISKQHVLEVFKANPKSMNLNVMENAFEKILEIANRLNKKQKVTAYIHKAAYHAYINEKEKSKEILLNLLKDKSLPNYLENRINSALISPTYTPDSKIYLQNWFCLDYLASDTQKYITKEFFYFFI